MKLSELKKFYEEQDFQDLKKHLALLVVRYGFDKVSEEMSNIINSLEDA